MLFGKKETFTLQIQGMSCGHCQQTVEEALAGVTGVKKVHVDLEAGRAEVQAKQGTDVQGLVEAVQAAGYQASPAG